VSLMRDRASEIEVKIEVADAGDAARRLIEAGAREVSPRELEDNVLLDWDDARLSRAGKILRVRRMGTKSVLTVKSPFENAPTAYKIRRETEVQVSDARTLLHALEDVGFRPVWRYQKWRRTLSLEGVTIVVDELPFGVYLEIEGEPAAIDRVARLLGFGPEHYETASYREIHERRCRAAGAPTGDLVFPGAAEDI